MLYFKNDKNEIFAYEESDLAHDEDIKAEVAALEAEKQNPPDLPDGEEPKDYDALIAELLTQIRISSELTQITEAEKDEILSPPEPSLEEQFQAEMDALNAQYDRDMLEASNKYNVAVARDGSTETEKVVDARAWIADLDAQYDADQLAIINKYYGA